MATPRGNHPRPSSLPHFCPKKSTPIPSPLPLVQPSIVSLCLFSTNLNSVVNLKPKTSAPRQPIYISPKAHVFLVDRPQPAVHLCPKTWSTSVPDPTTASDLSASALDHWLSATSPRTPGSAPTWICPAQLRPTKLCPAQLRPTQLCPTSAPDPQLRPRNRPAPPPPSSAPPSSAPAQLHPRPAPPPPSSAPAQLNPTYSAR